MADNSSDTPLWKPRTVKETQALYADWAEGYDSDVEDWGYATPGRVAEALNTYLPDLDAPILDFGCGTGVSGLALKSAGYAHIDGTDISPEMIEVARPKGCYRNLWVSEPGRFEAEPGAYAAVVAAGVISYGAAPPETLHVLLKGLVAGNLLAFSFNDPTLGDATYLQAVEDALAAKEIEMLFQEHGPHLPAKNMGSMVYVARKL